MDDRRQAPWLEDETFSRIWEEVSPYTMISRERGYALYLAIRYLVENRIHGSFVQCGVWRGGSVMLMLKTLIALGTGGREVYLLDTYEGMTEPAAVDVDCHGRPAAAILKEEADNPDSLVVARASLEEVRKNVLSCGYPEHRLHFVRGDVRHILPKVQTGVIALLYLDTDFYDSTLAELRHLYPRVNRDGVVFIDDYGHWQGACQAVRDYFGLSREDGSPEEKGGSDREKDEGAHPSRPLLLPVDYTGRVFIKRDRPHDILIRPYDYRSPGLEAPDLLPLFPSLQARAPLSRYWRYLRHNSPHIWRVDSRSLHRPNIGVLSVDEATLLHALARPFAGRRAVEIGCHFGWSTAHLIAAGVDLDVVDPALGNPAQMAEVRSSLQAVSENVKGCGDWRLWPGYSPGILPAVEAVQDGERWAFAFVDGNHDGEAPLRDALAVESRMADDAAIVFHDLLSPDVAAALAALEERGWKTRCYHTMQIMGIAWRGNVTPVDHVPDPNLTVPPFSHLQRWKLPVTGVLDLS